MTIDDWENFGFWIWDFGLKRTTSSVVSFLVQIRGTKDQGIFPLQSKIQNPKSLPQYADNCGGSHIGMNVVAGKALSVGVLGLDQISALEAELTPLRCEM
ncbi:MAG TPA: hypothetical protein VKM93_25835, partial [Terriglobia bacterium]|nr:hypothetical protein [Terriglobia bacterium]